MSLIFIYTLIGNIIFTDVTRVCFRGVFIANLLHTHGSTGLKRVFYLEQFREVF